jgi:hypothetical protein
MCPETANFAAINPFMEDKKRRISRIEWVLIIIAGLIFLSLVLERLGVPIVSTSEDSELIQRPHQ